MSSEMFHESDAGRRPVIHTCAAILGLLLAPSCGDPSESDDAQMQTPEDEIVDDLAEIPEPPPGARQYVVDEQIIPPGTEVQLCYFLEPEQEEFYIDALESFQGSYGHHLVLFYTVAPEEPGTMRDCTSLADMVTLIPLISSVNFGLEQFPEGMALRVPAGTQMVIQQHYVNTSEHPIRVRDGMHLSTVPEQEVEYRAGFYGVSDVSFQLAPDQQEREVSFECTIPRDMNLLLMGPHMHEYGLRFEASVIRQSEPGAPEESVVSVDPWVAEYRDEPPVVEWGIDNALSLREGDTLRTRCVFKNTSDQELGFPAEMCATYGYYFPAPMGSEAWTCSGD
ncbi:MAG: hypothetical protein KDK70_04960 [Myxococcales bacterium]|nr:hypothetical protein [Myxococcales bacterium]